MLNRFQIIHDAFTQETGSPHRTQLRKSASKFARAMDVILVST